MDQPCESQSKPESHENGQAEFHNGQDPREEIDNVVVGLEWGVGWAPDSVHSTENTHNV